MTQRTADAIDDHDDQRCGPSKHHDAFSRLKRGQQTPLSIQDNISVSQRCIRHCREAERLLEVGYGVEYGICHSPCARLDERGHEHHDNECANNQCTEENLMLRLTRRELETDLLGTAPVLGPTLGGLGSIITPGYTVLDDIWLFI